MLPAEIRQQDDIKPGQTFRISRVDRGEYLLIQEPPPPNIGLIEWLLDCPEKEFFTPIPSETTETLGPFDEISG